MSVVGFITSRKDKGNLSSPKTVFFYLHFPRWTFPVLAYHGADLWLPMSKGWTLAPQRCCSLWELLSSWLASCTRTQPGLCIVCGSSSRSLWTRHPDQEVFHFLLQGLKTTCMQCSRHTCLSCLLELGHLTLLLNLAFFSLGCSSHNLVTALMSLGIRSGILLS